MKQHPRMEGRKPRGWPYRRDVRRGKKMFIGLKTFFLAKQLHYKPFPPFPLFLPKTPLFLIKSTLDLLCGEMLSLHRGHGLGRAVAKARGVGGSGLWNPWSCGNWDPKSLSDSLEILQPGSGTRIWYRVCIITEAILLLSILVGNLLEMQILRPHFRLAQSKLWG